jgi:hypothetical protein
MEQWAARQFQGEHRDEILILNSAALGKMEAYRELIDMDMKEFNEVITEESTKNVSE